MNTKTQAKRTFKAENGYGQLKCSCFWNKSVLVMCRTHAAAPETAAERDRLKEVNAELLEACKELLSHFKNAYHTDEDSIKAFSGDLKKWENLIAKATGK